MLPILYTFRRCPYAMRARMALLRAGTPCELREVVLRHKPAHMVAISSKSTVPILQLSNGMVIDESLDIMHWALEQCDPDHWLKCEIALSYQLIEQNDGPFKTKLDRYKYFVKHPEHPQNYYRDSAVPFLQKLETLLIANHGQGLVASRITLADVAVFPFLRQFSKVDWHWFSQTPYQNLVRWLLRFEQSELFQSVMKKYPAWKEQDAVTVFGSS